MSDKRNPYQGHYEYYGLARAWDEGFAAAEVPDPAYTWSDDVDTSHRIVNNAYNVFKDLVANGWLAKIGGTDG